MRRHPERAAPSGTTWKRIPASAVAIVALVAVPTVVVAAALGLLAAPRFGTAWAVAAGVGYVLLAAAIAPLVLRLDEVRVRRPSRRFVQGFEDAAIGMAILSRDLTLVRVTERSASSSGGRWRISSVIASSSSPTPTTWCRASPSRS